MRSRSSSSAPHNVPAAVIPCELGSSSRDAHSLSSPDRAGESRERSGLRSGDLPMLNGPCAGCGVAGSQCGVPSRVRSPEKIW